MTMADFDKNKMDEITRGEAWLAGFKTPEASGELIERIKRATREQLARPAVLPRLFALRPWHGSLAAAAMLALCVGVAWYSRSQTPIGPGPMTDSGSIAVAPVPDEVEAIFYTFEGVEQGLSELDELAYDDAWSLDGVSLYSALDEAFSEDSGVDDEDSTSMRKGGDFGAEEVVS